MSIPRSKRDESSWLTPTQSKEQILVAELEATASKLHHDHIHSHSHSSSSSSGNVIAAAAGVQSPTNHASTDIEKDRLEAQLSQAVDSAAHLREANKELAKTVVASEHHLKSMEEEMQKLKDDNLEYKSQVYKLQVQISAASSSSSIGSPSSSRLSRNHNTAQAAKTQQVLAQTAALVFSLRSTFNSATVQLRQWQKVELENFSKLKKTVPSRRLSSTTSTGAHLPLPPSTPMSSSSYDLGSIGGLSLRSPESSPLTSPKNGDGRPSSSSSIDEHSGRGERNASTDAEVSFADPDTIFSSNDAKLVPLMRMQADLKGRLVAALAEAADERVRNQQLSNRITELEESLEKASSPNNSQNALLVETLEKLAEAQSASGAALAAAAASKSALISAEIQLRASKAELAAVLDEVQLMREESEQSVIQSQHQHQNGIYNSVNGGKKDVEGLQQEGDQKMVAEATAIAVQKAAEGAAAAAAAAYSQSLSEIRASYESRIATYRAEAEAAKDVIAGELASLQAAYSSASKDRDSASASLTACVAAFENERLVLVKRIEELEVISVTVAGQNHTEPAVIPPSTSSNQPSEPLQQEPSHPVETSTSTPSSSPPPPPRSSRKTLSRDTSSRHLVHSDDTTANDTTSRVTSPVASVVPTVTVIDRSPAATIVSFAPATPTSNTAPTSSSTSSSSSS
jgi:hypothetical protein